MSILEMVWFGGPRDGDTLLVPDHYSHGPIKVIYGTVGHRVECHVTPERMSDGRWILPFHESTKETR